jgi:1,4-alpha-glucan branching enzyme
MSLPREIIRAVITGEHGDPFSVLGPHQGSNGLITVRAFLPDAREATVVPLEPGASPQPLKPLDPAGLWEGDVHGRWPFAYRLRVVDPQGHGYEIEDPYRFPPTLTGYDLHLLGEGTHYRIYERLGAHPIRLADVDGTLFALWAPNARRVSVVGDWNGWDGRRHPMRLHPGNGIWELFLPNVGSDARYKFEILARSGVPLAHKSDPYAVAFEPDHPRTASAVYDLAGYSWGDGEWMSQRPQRQSLAGPISVYEVHLGSWKRVPEEGHRFLTYPELAHQLADYVAEMGFTHVELLPVMEHPFYGSWGYQTIGYYAPTRRYGMPKDFMAFVDTLHQRGIGVLLDWVPAHFPQDAHGLAYFDGSYLYEHEDPRWREHPDWGTRVFNYGRREVANYLHGNALYWLERYHTDGLRVDAVASMLYLDYSRKAGEWRPNIHGGRENLEAIAFIKRLNELCYGSHGDIITLAEESTAWPQVSRPVYLGGLGFGLKWNMGWMHDVLEYMHHDPVHRKYHHNQLTFGLLYAWTENFMLPLSHDEVVHGKGSLLARMPGDDWQRFANLRVLYAFMWAYPGKKLLFMGGEFGQVNEWNHETSLDWHLLEQGPYHRGMKRLVADLNRTYRSAPPLFEIDFEPAGFQWMDCNDWESSVISFVRYARDPRDLLLCTCNFTPVPRQGYRVGVPIGGFYVEVLNTDSEIYGGSNLGNGGGVQSEPVPWHGQPHSVVLTLPPLAVVWFRLAR